MAVAQAGKTTVDITAGTAAVSGVLGWLPATVSLVTGILAAIWLCIRIYESDTGQRWFRREPKD